MINKEYEMHEIMRNCLRRLCGKLHMMENQVRFPNRLFFFNDDDICLFDYNQLTKYLYVSYREIWQVFGRCFNLDYSEIQVVMMRLLSEDVVRVSGDTFIDDTDFGKYFGLIKKTHSDTLSCHWAENIFK